MKREIKKITTSILWLAIVAGMVVAGLRAGNIKDAESLYEWGYKKSQEVKACLAGDCKLPEISKHIATSHNDKKKNNSNNNSNSNNNKDNNDNNNNDTTTISEESVAQSLEDLENLKIEEDKKVSYDRKNWRHWISKEGRSCWNTREEILYRDAKEGTAQLLDKNKKRVDDVSKACYIVSGEWIDPYSGKQFNKASELDVDHIIPLGNAARHGGAEWTKEKKQEYANDPQVLISVSARENRSKSDKGPGEYMPPNRDYQKEYAMKYIGIAKKYGISITKADYEALKKALKN